MPKKIRIEKRDITKIFRHRLTAKEFESYGKESGRMNHDIEKLENDLAAHNKKAKGVISALRTELRTKLRALKTGHESREIVCVEVKNFTKQEVRWMVGSKTIESREMTAEEKQTSMQFNSKAKGKTAKSLEEKLKDDAKKFSEKNKKKANELNGTKRKAAAAKGEARI